MAEINVANRTLFHGDNLAFLRGINTETVDLVATDPPFNKGDDFHATPDSLAEGARFQDRWAWDETVHTEWVDKLEDDWPKVMRVINGSRLSYGDDMGAFLCFMGVRLIEMHRILKPTGSVYLHCDPTASHYLKELLDAIFGIRGFRNEIVWYYKNASRGRKQFAKSHDVIFWYSRSPKSYVFNRDDVLAPYESGMTAWRYKKQGKEPPAGKTPDDVVVMPSLNTMDSKERTGYPTQKPLALYELIIKASSSPGGWVLDPFAGCATTCVAAERLGRKWIGMDIWQGAHRIVLDRLAAEKLAVPQTAASAGGGGADAGGPGLRGRALRDKAAGAHRRRRGGRPIPPGQVQDPDRALAAPFPRRDRRAPSPSPGRARRRDLRRLRPCAGARVPRT